MTTHIEVTFKAITGTKTFHIDIDAVIDPNTGKPFEFASIHGKSWQINFGPNTNTIDDEPFTPCPSYCNHRGIYKFNSITNAYEPYNKEANKQISFHTPTGIVKFDVEPEAYTDPNTGKPYPFVHVHGKTWQTEFIAELPDYSEAFTPGGVPREMNHRGTYYYCAQSHAYLKMDC